MGKGVRGSRTAGTDRIARIAGDVAEAKAAGKIEPFVLKFHSRYGDLCRAFGVDRNGFLQWTDDLLKYTAGIGLSVLVKLAEDGDREAAVQLVKLYKGEPVQPFEIRVKQMTPDDADMEAVHELMDSLQISEAEARARWKVMIEQMALPPAPGDPP